MPRRAENDAVSITDGRLRIDDVPNDVSACLDRLVRQVPRLIKQVQDWMATNPRFGGLAEVRQQLPRLPLNATGTAKGEILPGPIGPTALVPDLHYSCRLK